MDFTEQSPVILSLCPGMRGLERGFDRACDQLGWRKHTTAAYVEIEAFIIWNLVKQMEQGVLAPHLFGRTLKPSTELLFMEKFTEIFGGYPCQPFSVAGQRKGTEDPRHLWPYIKEHIRAIEPVFCFFENVRGHLNLGFREVKQDLEKLGYKVEPGIYSAEEVGAPHKRERLFILAIKLGHAGKFGCNNVEKRSEQNVYDKIGKLQASELERNEQQCGTEQSSELADTEHEGSQGRDGVQGTIRPANGSGEELGNTNNQRLEGRDSEIGEECAGKRTIRSASSWPSRPGEPQHEWESPRVKSRMGFTINGYNFREDLLRMAGNGVVEQTAELAFIDLLNKFKTK